MAYAWYTRKQVRAQDWSDYTQDVLQRITQTVDARMKPICDKYLLDIGLHLKHIGQMTPSDVHRVVEMRKMGRTLKEMETLIGKAAKLSAAQVEEAMIKIAEDDSRIYTKLLGVDDFAFGENIALQRIAKNIARETAQMLRNLSNTTVVTTFYADAVDQAVTMVRSGVDDYNTAIRRTVRTTGAAGLRIKDGSQVVDYESGYSRRLDTAARQNVLDGVRHLNQSIADKIGRQFGADGVEIDAHMMCAEDHMPYQGGQYSNDEFEAIQDSLQRPFGEWNCRHSWHPIMLGISQPTYSGEQLQEMREYSSRDLEIDGKLKSRYEWSQVMRRAETAIRQQKDIATIAKAIGDKTLQRKAQTKVDALSEQYERIGNKCGIGADFGRTFVPTFRDMAKEASA